MLSEIEWFKKKLIKWVKITGFNIYILFHL